MAPLDWGELMELDPKNLGDDMDDLDGELVEVRTILAVLSINICS